MTACIDASIAGTAAAAGCLATSSGRPTAAITPSITSTEPGSCTVRPPSIGNTIPSWINTLLDSVAMPTAWPSVTAHPTNPPPPRFGHTPPRGRGGR